jgi:hypothetical protein
MRTISRLLLLLICASNAHGSPQAGDELIVVSEGKKYVHGFALGGGATLLVEEWKKAKGYNSVMSTGNYDGCYFKLVLRKKRLYLTAISVDAHNEKNGFFDAEIPVGTIYRQKETFADWFTGELYEYYGESVGYTEVKEMVRTYRFKSGDLITVEENRTEQEKKVEQAGAGQPATRSESNSEGGDKPQPESGGRSR